MVAMFGLMLEMVVDFCGGDVEFKWTLVVLVVVARLNFFL